MVAPSIASLNVALTVPLMGTSMAPVRGVWERTVGVPAVVPSREVEPPLLELPQATNENSSRKAEAGFQRGIFGSIIIRILSWGCGEGRRWGCIAHQRWGAPNTSTSALPVP